MRTHCKQTTARIVVIVIGAAAAGYLMGRSDERAEHGFSLVNPARAAEAPAGKGSTRRLPTYFPNTEALRPDEMRITALGTGLPTPITRAQKSTAWMVELGNGDVFLFDVGNRLDGEPLRAAPGLLQARQGLPESPALRPLRRPGCLHRRELAERTLYPAPRLRRVRRDAGARAPGQRSSLSMRALAWDIKGRTGILPDAGGEVVAHEFDYKKENQVVYEENGVTIRSWPAIHSLDGSVSYRLEWNGLVFVFGGDTRPNKWFIEYAKGADFAVHECFPTPEGLAAFNDWELRPVDLRDLVHPHAARRASARSCRRSSRAWRSLSIRSCFPTSTRECWRESARPTTAP